MRRSLLLRLLTLSLAVASLAVVATALLATYGTGSSLREKAESDISLLETDSEIRSALLGYAENHRGWAGVEGLVRDLAERTGRRITLTTPDGLPIADSALLLGQGSAELPAAPAARIDAAEPRGPMPGSDSMPGSESMPQVPVTEVLSSGAVLSYDGWQLTEEEKRRRRALADQATECLRREGVNVTFYIAEGPGQLKRGLFLQGPGGPELPIGARRFEGWPGDHACIPDELHAPSAAARKLNRETVDLITACLDERGLAYEVSTNSYGIRLVQPARNDAGEGEAEGTAGPEPSPAWHDCVRTSEIEAKRPYVAGPADLYLGTSERFDPFSSNGWWRTAATTAAVLLVAAAITFLAGRRLVRPILGLTAAARRMEAGDHAARVPVQGNDEVTRLARAFNAMAASVEHHDRQRKALVSDVAHELRTPLANVRSHLEAVEYGVLPLDGTLVRSLREESALLERLVADLQELALADAGMLPIHPEERDAADLAGQAVAAHRAQAEASGVSVRVDAPDSVAVYADPGRLRQALGNLVANAVTYTPAGGSVEVAVRKGDGSVVFTVADTGRGIDPEHLPYVFDRFYRADPSRSRTTGGSGLGLAISRHLVEAHGGRIEAESTPGVGSVFTIHLPAAPPSPRL